MKPEVMERGSAGMIGNGSRGRAGSLRRVRVADVDLAFREFGAGEPLVLIPAFATTMGMWDTRFLRRLAARYRVIAFDNRGMGHSTAGFAEWGIDQFAADAAGLIDALGLHKPHVLGWSMGGDIALSLAVHFPEKVDRLIIYAGDCGGPQKIDPPSYKDIRKKMLRDSPVAWALSPLFPPEWMKQHPDCWRTVPFLKMGIRPRSISRQNKAYNEWQGVYEELPSIESPTLVVSGTHDVSTPLENAFILGERIPRARLLLAPGAGHGLMYQYPYEFASAITDFMYAPSLKRVEFLRHDPVPPFRSGLVPSYGLATETG